MKQCEGIIEKIYSDDEELTLINRLCIAFHKTHCKNCATEARVYEKARISLHNFIPQFATQFAPRSVADNVMAMINYETAPFVSVSYASWITAGLVIMVSLSTAFFGKDFGRAVTEAGSAFLLPVSLTIGAVITAYSAMFIASHLEQLSAKFGLTEEASK